MFHFKLSESSIGGKHTVKNFTARVSLSYRSTFIPWLSQMEAVKGFGPKIFFKEAYYVKGVMNETIEYKRSEGADPVKYLPKCQPYTPAKTLKCIVAAGCFSLGQSACLSRCHQLNRIACGGNFALGLPLQLQS